MPECQEIIEFFLFLHKMAISREILTQVSNAEAGLQKRGRPGCLSKRAAGNDCATRNRVQRLRYRCHATPRYRYHRATGATIQNKARTD